MKVTDYIISYLISKGITDIFGYPGGVICHLLDSASKYPGQITVHTTYHEQGAAFAACGYAQEGNKPGVAFATSGPGATNLITGIANAYFDSIPTIFLTGQVDTYNMKGNLNIRQRGFQETDLVSMVETITKFAVCINDPKDICYYLEKAFYYANEGNPGPVLLDLPADVQRAEIEVDELKKFLKDNTEDIEKENALEILCKEIYFSQRPSFLIGNGVKQAGEKKAFRVIAEQLNIPTVFSMPAFDILPFEHPLNYGFIGANGHRYANFILAKSDLIISIGSRLDLKQVGNNRDQFAPNAKLIRVDIDEENFMYPVHSDEIQIKADISELFKIWVNNISIFKQTDTTWTGKCDFLKNRLFGMDDTQYTQTLREFCKCIPEESTITTDVGQSSVWVAQMLQVKGKQSVHMSAGHGAMGYSLPAAIGAYYARPRQVFCFNGDGGLQMNIQELQFIAREKIPVMIVVLNNQALGMIRGFQEANFEKNYTQTINGKGYQAPDFAKIAYAYQLPYLCIEDHSDLKKLENFNMGAGLIEIKLPMETLLNPNFGQNGLIQDQRPYIDRKLFEELMNL